MNRYSLCWRLARATVGGCGQGDDVVWACKRPRGLVAAIALALLIAWAGTARAQSPTVTSTDPAANAVGVPLGASVNAGFSAAISPTTVTTATFVTQGPMSGAFSGAYTLGAASRTVTLDPARAFFPGEVIRTTLTAGLSGTNGLAALPYQWQFTAGEVRPYSFQGFNDSGASLSGVYYSSVAWGDYDGDGDLDILLAGGPSPLSQVYRNDGSGTFTDIGGGLAGVYFGSAAWADYDGDGGLDILLTGYGNSGAVAKIYRNDGPAGGGAWTFTDVAAALAGVFYSAAASGDYDNDGDLDIILTGYDSASVRLTQLYRNDGDLTFTAVSTALPDVFAGSLAWGDYDSDGDLDLLLTGYDHASVPVSKIYRNDGPAAGGDWTFTDIGAALTGVGLSSPAWGDYDRDGDLDILLVGSIATTEGVSRVYRNDGPAGGGAWTFTDIGAALTDVGTSAAAWGDYDTDGDLDILLTGFDYNAWAPLAKVYRNDGPAEGGAWTFTDIGAELRNVYYGSVAWGDYDNDGDLDILLTGVASGDVPTALVYCNAGSLDLEFSKSVDPDPVQAGGTVTYTIYVTNTGEVALTADITDTLPAHVTSTLTPTWAGQPITAPLGTWSRTFTGTVSWGYSGPLTNVVRLTTPQGPLAVYTATAQVLVSPALTLTKQSSPTSVHPGDTLTYTICITNTGNVTLTADVVDTLPACLTAGGATQWLDQQIGSAWTRQITAAVSEDCAAVITNTVQVTTGQGISGTCKATTQFQASNGTTAYLPIVLKGH